MDSANLILTEPVLPPTPLEISSCVVRDVSCVTQYATGTPQSGNPIRNTQHEQIAKDFESVLLYKMLEEMKNTIGDWGFDKDGVSTQVQGIFWLHLAHEIANKGGLGLWKGIYEFLTDAERMNTMAEPLNKNI